MSLVKAEVKDFIGIITLDNQERYNVLSDQLTCDLVTALEEMSASKARVVILRSPPGVKVWSAGHDVKELPTSGRDPLAYNDPLRRAVRAVQTFLAPVIAMIEGTVWGGAVELVMSCDILIAGEDSTFAITPAKLGVPYNLTGILNFMRAVSLPVIKEMLFTAKPISAQRAREIGLINNVVSRSELETVTFEIAEQIGENAPLSVSVMKEELRVLSNARPLTPVDFERIQGLRRIVYDSKDYQEGIRSFFEKRKPVYKGE